MLRFFWQDPEPGSRQIKTPIEVKIDDMTWFYYYFPVFELAQSRPDDFKKMLREPVSLKIEEANIELGIYPPILRLLAEEKWGDAKRFCDHEKKELIEAGYQPDGIQVRAGSTWFFPFKEFR